MTVNVQRRVFGALSTLLVAAATLAVPAWAHHSFAAYNMDVTKVFTGVVTRINPDANHLQIFFAPMNDERKNVLRDGEPAGTRGPNGAIYKCPEKTPPAAGKHCDSVEGSTAIGTGGLLKPKG